MNSWKSWGICMSNKKTMVLQDCFSLRARIGWQGLRADEFLDYGPYLVTGTDFVNGKVNWDTCYHVTEERFKQDTGIQLKENDLLVTKDGTVGKTAFVVDCPEKTTLNSHIFLVRTTTGKVLPQYLYYILNSRFFEDFQANTLTGTTIKGLTQENFYKFSFPAPEDTKEQAKIAEVLATVDEAIDTTRRVIEKYKAIKVGLMHDVFEVEVAKCPSIILGKISEIARGGSPRPIQDYITDSQDGVNWIKIGDTSLDSKYVVSTKEKILPSGVSHSRKVKPGDFILSNSMSFGRPYILMIDGCIHDGWLVISKYEEKLDIDFLYYLLNSESVQKQFNALSAGSTVKNLKSETVKAVIIHLPDTVETQKELIKPLLAIDNSLENERNYLSRLLDIRDGLMQDLLTQKVSVEPIM